MKKSYPTLLATMVWAAIYSQQAYADLAAQCMLGIPVYTKPLVEGNSNDLPIRITAEDVRGEYPDFIEYTGDVDIQQGNQTLTADNVKLTQSDAANPVRIVTATGNVNYDDPQIILRGPKAWSNLNNKNTDVDQGDYQMVGRQGRGDAQKMKMRGENRYTILENGSFTTCLQGNNSWNVAGSEVIIDREEEVAEIWNARFRVGGVPVFYSPYLQLPIGNKRRSGFLIPTGSYSNNNGMEFALPYYWNIAPNYDATITPQFMTHRGVKINNEFRYLITPGSGTVAFDWLPHDRAYAKDKEDNKRDPRDSNERWLLYWRHSGVLAQNWHFNADYTKVSDRQYFTDFNSQYGNTTDGYATQKFSAGYSAENWNTTLSHKQFQIFVEDNNPNRRAYKAAPQLDFNYYKNDLGIFDFHTYAQAAHFTSVGKNQPDATRLHFEPELNMPLSNGWASINNSIKLMATHYDQDIPNTNTDDKLEKNVSRVLPMYKTDAKIVLERNLYQGSDYVQTLEPRVQYLYIPYKNQDNINNYDSALLQSDYNGLFRDRLYSGLDRIASANQVTTGITSRIYDDNLIERFNFSVGQIYYFERPRAGDSTFRVDDKSNTGSLIWAGDTYWRITDEWGVRGGVQYDRRLGNITMGNAVTEYRFDADRLLQLNYRFVDRDYIQATFRRDENQQTYALPAYQQGISQVGAVVSWPLSDQWGFVGSYYFDTKERQPASQMVGLQYNTCCWAVNLGYERKIVGWQIDKFSSEYDNKWSINVELRGLNNNHSLGSQKMLESGILPYQRAF